MREALNHAYRGAPYPHGPRPPVPREGQGELRRHGGLK